MRAFLSECRALSALSILLDDSHFRQNPDALPSALASAAEILKLALPPSLRKVRINFSRSGNIRVAIRLADARALHCCHDLERLLLSLRLDAVTIIVPHHALYCDSEAFGGIFPVLRHRGLLVIDGCGGESSFRVFTS